MCTGRESWAADRAFGGWGGVVGCFWFLIGEWSYVYHVATVLYSFAMPCTIYILNHGGGSAFTSVARRGVRAQQLRPRTRGGNGGGGGGCRVKGEERGGEGREGRATTVGKDNLSRV